MLVYVSTRKDFFCHVKIFHSSSQIVFSDNEAPKNDKIYIWPCSRVGMGFMQQLRLLFGFLSPFLDNFDYLKICVFFEVVERGSKQ